MTANNRLQSEAMQHDALEIGTRLKALPSTSMVSTAFADELNNEALLFTAVGLADIAHTWVALELKTIPKLAGRELLAYLLALQAAPDSFVLTAENGDIYTNREAWLTERTDAVNWLGAGRARREAVTTGFILVVRQDLIELIDHLIDLATTLVQQAEQHLTAIMPDYTYLQAAQPTTFGHYLLGFAYPLLRDLERLEHVFARLNLSPMGCGSTNGSRLLQGRQALAECLGFDGLIAHARDAMWQADLFIEITSILTACSISISRLAEDLQIFCSQEFALVELADKHARASKIMPHKKNPFALTHLRGVANKLIGLTASVAASVRTPTGQPDNRTLIYGALPDALENVSHATVLMAEVLDAMVFNQHRAKILASSGWVLATELAETVVLLDGLDVRSSHRLLAYLASEYRELSLPELDYQNLQAAAKKLLGRTLAITKQQFSSALDLDGAIQARLEPGGTASASMNTMIVECRQRLLEYRERNWSRQEHISGKIQTLLALAKRETSHDSNNV